MFHRDEQIWDIVCVESRFTRKVKPRSEIPKETFAASYKEGFYHTAKVFYIFIFVTKLLILFILKHIIVVIL